MNVNMTEYVGGPTATEELQAMSTEELRAIKLRFSEAKGNTHEHKMFTMVDRIIRSREGTWMGRTF